MKLTKLACRVKKYLAHKRLTIEDFAKKAGVSVRVIKKLLSGDIGLSYATISKVAAAMGKSLELKLLNLASPIKRQRGDVNENHKNGACGEAGQPADKAF